MEECKKQNIDYLCTPFSRDGSDELENIGVGFFKIGSGELTNLPLIEHVAKKNKPLILSTGMCNMDEIEMAARIIKSTGNNDFAFLQCTTNYPSTLNDANLKAMQTMRKKFKIPFREGFFTTNLLGP